MIFYINWNENIFSKKSIFLLLAIFIVLKVFVSYISFEGFMEVTVKVVAFWVITPYSLISGYWCFGGTCSLHIQDWIVWVEESSGLYQVTICRIYLLIQPSWFLTLHTSTLRMKATFSSETSVSTYKTTWCHNPEDHSLKFFALVDQYGNSHLIPRIPSSKPWLYVKRR
jgi:hypothetical protein